MRASYFLHEYALNKQTIRTQVLISCTWISWFVCFLLIVLIHMFCKGALFFVWHRAYIKLSTIEAFPLSEIKILLLYSFSIVLYWTVAALLFTSSNYFINIEELIVVWEVASNNFFNFFWTNAWLWTWMYCCGVACMSRATAVGRRLFRNFSIGARCSFCF